MSVINNQKFYTDEELDAMEEVSRVANSRKANAPAFIMTLLIKYSSPGRHLKQSELQQLLWDKFDFKLERKAVGRHVHNLASEELGIICAPNGEVWYDKAEEIWEFCA